MNVSFIIPIEKHLANFLKMPAIEQMNYSQAHWRFSIIQSSFFEYAGFRVNQNKLVDRYFKNKLFRKLRPDQYPPELISKYPDAKFTYLKFNLPVYNERSDNTTRNQDHSFFISFINASLNNTFWRIAVFEILLNRKTTIKKAIYNHYKQFGIKESDFKPSSFKSILYRKSKDDYFYQHYSKRKVFYKKF